MYVEIYILKQFVSTESIAECALCRAIISEIDKLLGNSKVDAEIEEIVEKVCKYLPANKRDKVFNDFSRSQFHIAKLHEM